MASPRPPRRRRGEDLPEPEDDDVRLDADEHAWWAQRTTEQVWTPRERPAAEEAPARDVLAEHFGADWRTSFGFDPPPRGGDAETDAEPGPATAVDPPHAVVADDPYAVLGVTPEATWEEIVAAHRSAARANHPDLAASNRSPSRRRRAIASAPSTSPTRSSACAEDTERACRAGDALERRVRDGRAAPAPARGGLPATGPAGPRRRLPGPTPPRLRRPASPASRRAGRVPLPRAASSPAPSSRG